MQVCFDKLMLDRPVAVHFDSAEEAEAFLIEMKSRYPERVREWSVGSPHLYAHYNMGGTCFCPYLNRKNGFMTHGSRYTFEILRGYQVVEFKDLLYDSEIEVNEVDLPVEFLFV